MLLVKPGHKRYVFHNVTATDYVDLAQKYSSCKRFGFRVVVAFGTGTGGLGVIKSVLKGQLIQYGKRRIASFVITGATYVCAPAIEVLTNATRVVKCCKVVYC